MKHKSLLALFLVIHFCGVSIISQSRKSRPDFDGTWIQKKSSGDKFSLDISPTKSNKISKSKCSIKRLIEHNDPELKIRDITVCGNAPDQDTTETVRTYYTDSRGELNKWFSGKISTESRTYWDRQKIVITEKFFNNGVEISNQVLEITITGNGQKLKEKKFFFRKGENALTKKSSPSLESVYELSDQ